MAYWGGAFWRAINQAWEWPNSHSYLFAIFTVIIGAVFSAMTAKIFNLDGTKQRPWIILIEKLGILALSGVVLTFFGSVLVFVSLDPAERIRLADERLMEQQNNDQETVKRLVDRVSKLEESLKERDKRKEIRVALSKFIFEGTAIMAQIVNLSEDDAVRMSNNWDARLKNYLIQNLNESYYVELGDMSDIAQRPQFNKNAGDETAMWIALHNLQKILQKFQ
jgi:hypothetical protein